MPILLCYKYTSDYKYEIDKTTLPDGVLVNNVNEGYHWIHLINKTNTPLVFKEYRKIQTKDEKSGKFKLTDVYINRYKLLSGKGYEWDIDDNTWVDYWARYNGEIILNEQEPDNLIFAKEFGDHIFDLPEPQVFFIKAFFGEKEINIKVRLIYDEIKEHNCEGKEQYVEPSVVITFLQKLKHFIGYFFN